MELSRIGTSKLTVTLFVNNLTGLQQLPNQQVHIIGGGLAGCEAALQLAGQGIPVTIFEMRPVRPTPAHKTDNLAELVCSNSFKGLALTSAHGLFKKELLHLGAEILQCAIKSKVEAGESLAIDREKFANEVGQKIAGNPLIKVERKEITQLDPKQLTLIATGPLTSDTLGRQLQQLTGSNRLFFFDSIAPVVEVDSIDMDHAFYKNRWDKGNTADFINCPLNEPTYRQFVEELRKADAVEPKPFEKGQLFEGCLPVEEMAKRGEQTLRFGPMRPIGLKPSEDEKVPYAVIQLRAENQEKTLYNLIGFQTRLKWGTQKRIFSLVPALKNAKFARMGAMHRNTFIDSPQLLNPHLKFGEYPWYFAGQITGAEGYTEAVATGFYAATAIAAGLKGLPDFQWPRESCTFSLVRHLTAPNPDFQPMNFNFGLLPKVDSVPKKQKKAFQAEHCLKSIEKFDPFPGKPNPVI